MSVVSSAGDIDVADVQVGDRVLICWPRHSTNAIEMTVVELPTGPDMVLHKVVADGAEKALYSRLEMGIISHQPSELRVGTAVDVKIDESERWPGAQDVEPGVIEQVHVNTSTRNSLRVGECTYKVRFTSINDAWWFRADTLSPGGIREAEITIPEEWFKVLNWVGQHQQERITERVFSTGVLRWSRSDGYKVRSPGFDLFDYRGDRHWTDDVMDELVEDTDLLEWRSESHGSRFVHLTHHGDEELRKYRKVHVYPKNEVAS
jgi:hypothetical protein